jgi:hypothetical protein
MSISYIPDTVKVRLWGKAAGRCQYEGCNKPLWLDSLTKAEFNTSYIAHIVADSEDGPRGDKILSAKLAKDISNLMLMCDEHHRLIDKADVAGHSISRLTGMKKKHESRIEIVSAISEEKQSHILLYGANIGSQSSPLSYREASEAMSPDRYPTDTHPITLGLLNSSFEDHNSNYWELENQQLVNIFNQQVRPRLKSGEIQHLSIFALAPQPLLMRLGFLLSDIQSSDVFQLRREPRSWKWEASSSQFEYKISAPSVVATGDAALVFSLSGTITNDRVNAAIGKEIPIWTVSIETPHNDFLRSRPQTEAFRRQMRTLLDRIKKAHGQNAKLHVFPAMPVALAVDFGKLVMPKADLKMLIYDENRKLGGFVPTLHVCGS